MNVLVVYESFTGNTRQIAEAVASGIAKTRPDVHVRVHVAAAPSPEISPDLLVVGAPVHAWGPPRPGTRTAWLHARQNAERSASARPAAEEDAAGPGAFECVAALPTSHAGGMSAVFDTRLPSRFAGSATGRISRKLRSRGYRLVRPPEHFIVRTGQGPLQEGELDRARAWGADLAALLPHPASRG